MQAGKPEELKNRLKTVQQRKDISLETQMYIGQIFINDFQDYAYTAGITDDGIGTPLPVFISFQIKIIMQGTNCAEPPRIKDFRTLALAT